VRFECRDAGDPAVPGQYDLVTFFETLHDLADPVKALRAAAALLATGGAVLIGDEKVAETFTAPGDELERFNYGWSALHCLPTSLTEPTSVGTGTVIRPDTVRRFAREACFSAVTVLPIEHDFWRFYAWTRRPLPTAHAAVQPGNNRMFADGRARHRHPPVRADVERHPQLRAAWRAKPASSELILDRAD
jgi:hypothetical protein